MFLKVGTLLVALQFTLLISFINAETTNESNLRQQLNNDLNDNNSDLRWWEFFVAAASNADDAKKPAVLSTAESAAFDVVQTHLKDEEIPDEEETPKVAIAPTQSIGAVKKPIATSPVKRPAVQQPRKPIVAATATASSVTSVESDDDEEEFDSNSIIIKPAAKKPSTVAVQPTKSRPVASGGVKGRQPVTSRPARPVVINTTTRPAIITTIDTRTSRESDEEEEIIVTTKKPISVKKFPAKPTGTKTQQPKPVSVGVKGGTKTKTAPAPAPRPSARPVIITSRPAPTTTIRPIIKTEESEEDEPLPTSRPIAQPVPKKVPVPAKPVVVRQPAPARPVVSGVKRPVQVETKSQPLPPTKIGTKQPSKTSPAGTKSRPAPQQPRITPIRPVQTTSRPITTTTSRPAPTTTTRPIVITEENEDEEPLPVARPVVPAPQPRKVPVAQPTKRPVPSGTKTSPAPQITRKVQVTTTTRPSTIIIEDTEDEPERNTINRQPIPSLPRKVVPVPTKTIQPSSGVKGRQPIFKPTVPTTVRPSSTRSDEENDTESDNTIPERPISPVRKMQRPQTIQPTKSRPQSGTKTKPVPTKISPRPVVTQAPRIAVTTSRPAPAVTENEDEEEETSAPITTPQPRKPIVTTKRPVINGVKRPVSQPQPGTKTRVIQPSEKPRVQITTVRTTAVSEETDEEEEIGTTRASIVPTIRTVTLAPRRPQIQTTTVRPTLVEETDDEDEETGNEIVIPKKPVVAPAPRQNIGTKTRPQPGTKIPARPAPAPLPRVVPVRPTITTTRPAPTTTTRPLVTTEENDETEDELPTARPVAPAPKTQRPQIQTTTKRPVVIVEENDEEERNEVEVPRKPVPAPLPRRPLGTKTPARPQPGTKTRPAPVPIPQRPVVVRTTPRPTTTTEAEEENETEAPARPRPAVPAPRPVGTKTPARPAPVPVPQRPVVVRTTPRPTTTTEAEEENETEAPARPRPAVPAPRPRPRVVITTSSPLPEEDEEENTDAPTTRRPVPSPRPRPTGVKGGFVPTPVKPRVPITRPQPTTTLAPSTVEEDEPEQPIATIRPVPQPRPRGVLIPTPVAGTKTRPAPRIVTTTSRPAVVEPEETDEEEKLPEPAIKQPIRPIVPGRKVVVKVTVRPTPLETTTNENTTPSIVTSTTAANVASKTRVEKMNVPRPVSFSRKSSKTSPPKETVETEITTLEPIPVPVFESTRRPSQNPIIQSTSFDNDEDDSPALEASQARKRGVIRNSERLYSSDLAKFSSRVRFAERISTGPIKSQFSSYSPPLVEPNNESFLEINRIK